MSSHHYLFNCAWYGGMQEKGKLLSQGVKFSVQTRLCGNVVAEEGGPRGLGMLQGVGWFW